MSLFSLVFTCSVCFVSQLEADELHSTIQDQARAQSVASRQVTHDLGFQCFCVHTEHFTLVRTKKSSHAMIEG
jgi:hypothetical protein